MLAALGLIAISVITFGVSRLKPAAPSLERATALIETVKRGPMLRDVHGTGTLVAEDIRVIAASTAGRVERVLVHPGTPVNPKTILVELSNPELQQSAVDTEYQLRAAAMYADAGNRLRNSADWDKQDAQYKQQIADKQKSIDDAKQKLADMQDQARQAGMPESTQQQ